MASLIRPIKLPTTHSTVSESASRNGSGDNARGVYMARLTCTIAVWSLHCFKSAMGRCAGYARSRLAKKSVSTMSFNGARAATIARKISGSPIWRVTDTRSGGHGHGMDKGSNQTARRFQGEGESGGQVDGRVRDAGS